MTDREFLHFFTSLNPRSPQRYTLTVSAERRCAECGYQLPKYLCWNHLVIVAPDPADFLSLQEAADLNYGGINQLVRLDETFPYQDSIQLKNCDPDLPPALCPSEFEKLDYPPDVRGI